MRFGSSEPAIRDAHWVWDASFIVVAALFLFILYVLIRHLFTKSEKLHLAPGHIQQASAILQWASIFSILLVLLGSCFEFYDQIWKAGIAGPINQVLPFLLFLQFCVFLGVGVSVSLFALTGIGLIFVKRLRYQKRDRKRE